MRELVDKSQIALVNLNFLSLYTYTGTVKSLNVTFLVTKGWDKSLFSTTIKVTSSPCKVTFLSWGILK